jgi:branched-chain amino acid transport system permease protein
MPLIRAILLAACAPRRSASCSACPACACKGLYLAVATLAAQFFSDWMFLRIKWFTIDSPSGSGVRQRPAGVRSSIESANSKYWFCLAILVVMALLAKNLVRSAIGRIVGWQSATWTSPRRYRHPPDVRQAERLRGELLHRRGGRRAVGLRLPRCVGACRLLGGPVLPLLFMVIIGGLGSISGAFFGAAFIVVLPIFLNQFLPAFASLFGITISTAGISHAELMIFGALIVCS